MSAGSPIIKCRVSQYTLDRVREEVARLTESDVSRIRTVSDFVCAAIWELLKKRARRTRSRLRAKERRRLATESAAESQRIYDEMQAELSRYT